MVEKKPKHQLIQQKRFSMPQCLTIWDSMQEIRVNTSHSEVLRGTIKEFTAYRCRKMNPNPNPRHISNDDYIDTITAENTRLSIAEPLISIFEIVLIELHRYTAMVSSADNLDQYR
jgi:hypothetical protein